MNAFPSRRRSILGRLFRSLVILALLAMLIPMGLVVLYRVVDPVSTLMLSRWVTGAPVERTWVPLREIAPVLPASVIAAEDARFCEHGGIDFDALNDIIENADDLSEARGGSTITQQTAKNLFLWNSRSFIRKGLEFPLALWMGLVLPQARVMEIYLNIAEWGPNGQFGAEAGARYAFGRSARSLTSREAALMAAILPNPLRRSARKPGAGVHRLAGIYQARARTADVTCLKTALVKR